MSDSFDCFRSINNFEFNDNHQNLQISPNIFKNPFHNYKIIKKKNKSKSFASPKSVFYNEGGNNTRYSHKRKYVIYI